MKINFSKNRIKGIAVYIQTRQNKVESIKIFERLIDETPENTQANIQSWCWIAFCKHIVTCKGTFTEFETIQVFTTQVNAECADAEIHVCCNFRQSHADGLRILVKKLAGER